LAQPRPAAAVDETGRQMEEKIDQPRPLVVAAEQAAIQLLEPWPDAG
jgi:hypothetical protein